MLDMDDTNLCAFLIKNWDDDAPETLETAVQTWLKSDLDIIQSLDATLRNAGYEPVFLDNVTFTAHKADLT